MINKQLISEVVILTEKFLMSIDELAIDIDSYEKYIYLIHIYQKIDTNRKQLKTNFFGEPIIEIRSYLTDLIEAIDKIYTRYINIEFSNFKDEAEAYFIMLELSEGIS